MKASVNVLGATKLTIPKLTRGSELFFEFMAGNKWLKIQDVTYSYETIDITLNCSKSMAFLVCDYINENL